jgi:hypothetical protein
VAPTVLTPDHVPLPRQDGQERGVHEGECASAAIRSVGGEHRQQDQNAHLDEDDVAGAPILAAMQVEIERSVDPGDPDQGEDDGELGECAHGDVLGEVIGRLADDGHIDEVVEELEEADPPVGHGLAVCSRRAPEPTLEPALEPAARLISHGVKVASHPAPGRLLPEGRRSPGTW